jgi:hypothetical protein
MTDGNIRNTKPISLHPLTPEEAIRRALSAPPPAKEAKPKAKPAKRAMRKKGDN